MALNGESYRAFANNLLKEGSHSMNDNVSSSRASELQRLVICTLSSGFPRYASVERKLY